MDLVAITGMIALPTPASIMMPPGGICLGGGSLLPLGQVPPAAAGLSLFQAIVLGLVQGLTEFLPISSTAHLKVVPVLLGWGDPGVSFTAVIQLGSIAAILWYFWADLVAVVQGVIRTGLQGDYQAQEFQLGLGIVLGTLPIVLLGLAVKVLIPDFDRSPLRTTAAIAIASIAMALLLALAERFSRHRRGFESLGLRDGLLMGLAQALAIIPGVSRSGSTLTAGLAMGLERATAARFSFLLGIPAITLAGLVELRELLDPTLSAVALLPLAAGLISALVSSYLSIVWLLNFLKKHTTWAFVWYRLGFGLTLLLGIAGGMVENI